MKQVNVEKKDVHLGTQFFSRSWVYFLVYITYCEPSEKARLWYKVNRL